MYRKNPTSQEVLCGDARQFAPRSVYSCTSVKTMAMPAIHLHGENPWKLGLGFLVSTLFFGLGHAHVFRPGYFIGVLVSQRRRTADRIQPHRSSDGRTCGGIVCAWRLVRHRARVAPTVNHLHLK